MKTFQTRVPLVTKAGQGAGDGEISYGFDGGRCVLRLQADEIDITEEATDFFGALCGVRLKLETRGLFVAVYGSSRTVFPSGMCIDMAAGLKAHRLSLGERGDNLVDIFDTGPDIEVATVDQQRAFYRQWLASIGIDMNGVC